jgi:hypothetical protein
LCTMACFPQLLHFPLNARQPPFPLNASSARCFPRSFSPLL